MILKQTHPFRSGKVGSAFVRIKTNQKLSMEISLPDARHIG